LAVDPEERSKRGNVKAPGPRNPTQVASYLSSPSPRSPSCFPGSTPGRQEASALCSWAAFLHWKRPNPYGFWRHVSPLDATSRSVDLTAPFPIATAPAGQKSNSLLLGARGRFLRSSLHCAPGPGLPPAKASHRLFLSSSHPNRTERVRPSSDPSRRTQSIVSRPRSSPLLG